MSLEFIDSNGPEKGIRALAHQIAGSIGAGRRTVWLIAGGSNVAVAVSVMNYLRSLERAIPNNVLDFLSITLTDERYGHVGHADSNWKKLMDAGFDVSHAHVVPVLRGLSFEKTAEKWARDLDLAFEGAQMVVGQFGMGADGHIAGILPNSIATEATGLVSAYVGPDFKRITTTFDAIEKVHEAYLFAFGPEKRPALEKLRTFEVTPREQPVQILKKIKQSHVFF